MKRVLTVVAVLGAMLLAAPLAQASWTASGTAPVANRTAAHTAKLKPPTFTSATKCNTANKVTAFWTLGTGLLTPTVWTITDSVQGNIPIGSVTSSTTGGVTTYSATSTGTYKNDNLNLTVTGKYTSTTLWQETSPALAQFKC